MLCGLNAAGRGPVAPVLSYPFIQVGHENSLYHRYFRAVYRGAVVDRPDTYAELRELPPPTVKIGQVRVKDLQPVTRVTGKLQPARRANLHFQVAGQVDARLVEAGQPVAAGAILLSIENGDFIDAAAESEALLKTERDALRRDSRLLELMRQERQLQEQEVARLERLGQKSLSSKSNYDQARQVLYRQQAEEARLQHSVDAVRSPPADRAGPAQQAERNLRRTRLKAPVQRHGQQGSCRGGRLCGAGSGRAGNCRTGAA